MDIDTLQRIQRRATKIIPELRDLTYEERLKECGLTTLETRRLSGDQIEVFKILNGYENSDRNMFFSLKKDSRTRGRGKISKRIIVDWTLGSTCSYRGPSMNETNCLRIV